MARDHHYEIITSWSGAAAGPTTDYKSYSREYRFHAGDKPEQRGSADPAFHGDPALYNPEELLVAALSSCHMLSYLALCALQGVQVVAYEDKASGTMAESHGAGAFTEVVLHPQVTIAKGGDRAKAAALHEKAHEICFIAASVNFPVRHEVTIGEAG